MTRALKVLLVEDRPEDAELLLREMDSRGLSVSSRLVETSAQFEAALDDFSPDLILSDYTLPGFHASGRTLRSYSYPAR
jgi:pentatricopeptide repeat protein